MLRTKNGATVEPSLGQVITLIVVAGIAILVGIALVCPLLSSTRGAVPFYNNNTGLSFSCVTIMIILMIAATLSGAISAYTKYGTYKSAKASYIARRNALVSYLNQSQGYSNMPGPGS